MEVRSGWAARVLGDRLPCGSYALNCTHQVRGGPFGELGRHEGPALRVEVLAGRPSTPGGGRLTMAGSITDWSRAPNSDETAISTRATHVRLCPMAERRRAGKRVTAEDYEAFITSLCVLPPGPERDQCVNHSIAGLLDCTRTFD